MPDLFKNKYRISSARLQSWDYADNGMYFVTICTTNKECFFGDCGGCGCRDAMHRVSITTMEIDSGKTNSAPNEKIWLR